MNILYWLTVLGNFKTLILVIFGIGTLLSAISIALYFMTLYEKNDNACKDFKKLCKITITTAVLAAILQSFVPDTKQLYFIYGIGGNIDYIKNNDTSKQLPDKVINVLDKYIDSLNEDENS